MSVMSVFSRLKVNLRSYVIFEGEMEDIKAKKDEAYAILLCVVLFRLNCIF